MKANRLASLAALSFALPGMVLAEGKVTTKYSFQHTDGRKVSSQKSVEVSSRAMKYSSDEKMSKTLLLLNVANEIKNSLGAYAKACGDRPDIHPRPIPFPRPIPRPMPIVGPVMPPHPLPLPVESCQPARLAIAKQLHGTIAKLDGDLNQNPFARSDRGAIEAIDYARKLARNMEKTPEPIRYYGGLERIKTAGAPMAMAAGGLNVTSGGAQGYEQFKKLVDGGSVPDSEVLSIDGFLKEFDLSLSDDRCDDLICVSPAVSLDRAAKKMFVQIAMGSNVRPESFKRKPLNLSVVLDVSGSMGATDGTEKSRLEWAKDALNRIVDRLGGDDYLSIVLFDHASRIALQPQPVTNRRDLKVLVDSIKLGGSTNLELGMRDGLKLVRANVEKLPGYEHRVITISDAGVNTGIQDEASFVRLVNTYANDGVGVTVLGVGDDFRGGLVQGFSMTRGGNFQHAQTGLAMMKFFENFDFLVTPVAYNFKASLSLNGLNAKFAKAYGVPVKEGQPVDELIDIQTLFFSTGGGAIVLEYDLK